MFSYFDYNPGFRDMHVTGLDEDDSYNTVPGYEDWVCSYYYSPYYDTGLLMFVSDPTGEKLWTDFLNEGDKEDKENQAKGILEQAADHLCSYLPNKRACRAGKTGMFREYAEGSAYDIAIIDRR